MWVLIFTVIFLMSLGLFCIYQGVRKRGAREEAMDLRPKWLRAEGADDVSRGMVLAMGVAFLTIGVAILIISIIEWLKP